jgi:hypothetical protein
MTLFVGLVLVSLLLPFGVVSFPNDVPLVGESGPGYVRVPVEAVSHDPLHSKRQTGLRTYSYNNGSSYSVRGTSVRASAN